MQDRSIADLEAPIRDACTRHELETAIRLTLELYGCELLQYVIARLRSYDEGCDAYSLFAEDLWKGLPKFEWRSSLRCWAYTLARNASNRHARAHARRSARRDDGNLEAEAVAQPPRSETQRHLLTSAKQQIRLLRARLSRDEQELLTLRVDRKLSWSELARILHDGPEPAPEVLAREEARLRKRYERITQHLRALARSEGLLG